MFAKHVFNKITALPEEKQRQLIQYLSANPSSNRLIDKCRAELRETCTVRETELVMEVLAHLNYLHTNNTDGKFQELADELAVPGQLKRLYLHEDVIAKTLPVAYDYKWRIDISVPKASAVLVNITRGEEQVCFRLDISTYHKLRFNVALLLKELSAVRKSYARIKKF